MQVEKGDSVKIMTNIWEICIKESQSTSIKEALGKLKPRVGQACGIVSKYDLDFETYVRLYNLHDHSFAEALRIPEGLSD